MKKILIGIFFLGFTTLMYSQTAIEPEGLLSKVKTLSPLNSNYENTVYDLDISKRVKYLQNLAAEYNVKKHENYKEGVESFRVVFKENNQYKGTIVATYNRNGEITDSFEQYRDVQLPLAVRQSITNLYPDYIILKDIYIVKYSKDGEITKLYKIKMTNDRDKVTIKMNQNGNLIE